MQPIRNREAAAIQITAEQLIKDARTQFGEINKNIAGSSYYSKDEFKIQDKEELAQFLQTKRKEYEDRIRRHKRVLRSYLDYARFEAAQDDYRRCRSILERAMSVFASDPALWLAYSEIEAKGGFMNHALNVLNRAVAILPRVDSLWFRYVLYQESAGTVEETRAIFERWMAWEPESDEPWFAYASFEERHKETGRARDVYERYCGTHPSARAYIKYAKWEDSGNRIANARNVFERAVGATENETPPELPDGELLKPDIWLAFANFEAKRNEPERARAVFQFSLEKVEPEYRGRVFAQFAAFEKTLKDAALTGDGTESDTIVILRRREEYENRVKQDPRDYDSWFDLIRLEESQKDFERIRATYSRAQSNPPQQLEKRFWRRFVYLFIYESLFEELAAKDINRARLALRRGLDVVPHKMFTFAKLWVMAAHLEIRCKDLNAARKLLGRAIGLCPKDKIFRSYIQLELQLGQVDRCRTLYEKYLTFTPANAQAWSRFAEMERTVGEMKRARAIYELGVSQPILDEPEKLWLRYIDFEIASDEEEEEDEEVQNENNKVKTTGAERARQLYERLIARTEGKQARVWIALAKFLALGSQFGPEQARQVLDRAEKTLKGFGPSGQDGRAQICFARVDLENKLLEMAAEEDKDKALADKSHLEAAKELVPKKVERISEEDGTVKVEWLFPADVREEAERRANDTKVQMKTAALRMLELAEQRKRMKQQQQQEQEEGGKS